MTSMPLTSRRIWGVALMVLLSGLALGRRAARELLFAGVLVGRALHHRLDDLLVALVPVGREVPLAAVPGVDAGPRRTHVILARGRDRPHHTGKAECVELFLVERQ